MEQEDYIKLLGAQIKRLRESKGITQQELAYACDFEKSNMSRIEAGRTNPTVKTLLKISQVLNIEIHELLLIKEIS